MLIPVIYPDGRHDLVKDFYLSYLIEQNNITQFKRKEGWAVVGRDPVRGMNRGQVIEKERRWH